MKLYLSTSKGIMMMMMIMIITIIIIVIIMAELRRITNRMLIIN